MGSIITLHGGEAKVARGTRQAHSSLLYFHFHIGAYQKFRMTVHVDVRYRRRENRSTKQESKYHTIP